MEPTRQSSEFKYPGNYGNTAPPNKKLDDHNKLEITKVLEYLHVAKNELKEAEVDLAMFRATGGKYGSGKRPEGLTKEMARDEILTTGNSLIGRVKEKKEAVGDAQAKLEELTGKIYQKTIMEKLSHFFSKAFEKAHHQISSSFQTRSTEKLIPLKPNVEDIADTLQQYQKYHAESPLKASFYILTPDARGQTFLHHLTDMSQNIQFNTVQDIFSTLDPEVLKRALLTKDKNGQTPLGIAIGKGQMAVVSKIFPIPPGNEIKFTPEEKKIIEDEINKTLLILSDPKKCEKHLKKCPGPTQFDNRNHILSALNAAFCHGIDFQDILESMPSKSFSNLPYELKFLYTNGEDLIPTFEALSNECLALSTEKSVGDKMNEWNYQPQRLPNVNKLDMKGALALNQNNNLAGIIKGALEGIVSGDDNPATNGKNACLNYLAILLNPYEPYDQKIDLMSPKLSDTLHLVVEMALNNPELDLQKDVKPILTSLILKYPDFLQGANENKLLVKDLILAQEKTERSEEIDQLFIDIQRNHPQELREIRIKKALMQFLESKGRSLMVAGQ